MRNLKASDKDSYEFISGVIKATRKRKGDDELLKKGKPTYKDRCMDIARKYKSQIVMYDQKFSEDKLENLVDIHPQISPNDKADYQSLYGYDKALIKKLRTEILSSNGFYNAKCPLCEVNVVQTMDHFIPQTKFPLYSISPKNLIPSCHSCNGHKLDAVLDGDKRKYWNVYLDKVPTEKFLYCTLKECNGLLLANFYVQQNGMRNNTFRLLKNTMEDQHVLQTFSDGAGEVIQKLCSDMIECKKRNPNMTWDEIFSQKKEMFVGVEKSNNWEEVLELELVKSEVFKEIVRKEYDRLND